MAVLISNRNGNFTSSSTWSLVDSTSYVNSEANNTNTTVAFVSSTTFSLPSAITIDGIAVKINSRAAAPTGTFTVQIASGATGVAGTGVAINAIDVPFTTNNTGNDGWLFMGFTGGTVTLSSTTAYNVQVKSSVAGTVGLYRTATAGDWSKALRTTTNQAPVAGDETITCGIFSGAGTNTVFTVTMDNTGSTVYGPVNVCSNGIFNWGVSAGTNFLLNISGNTNIYSNATYNIGTIANPVPSSSTASLSFSNISVNVGIGLEARIGSSFTTYGAAKVNSALLAKDIPITATTSTLTTNVNTSWSIGDTIGIASTTRTIADTEQQTLVSATTGTSIIVSAMTAAHSGTTPVVAELINLTRNVKIFGTSNSLQTYINLADATMNLYNTELYFMGSATANKRGITLGNINNSVIMSGCALHDFVVASSIGILSNVGTWNNSTIDSCVFYNIAANAISIATTTGRAWTVSNAIAMKNITAGSTLLSMASLNGSIHDLTAAGSVAVGISLTTGNGIAGWSGTTTSGFTAHSNGTDGVSLANASSVLSGTAFSITSYRNVNAGVIFSNSFAVTIDTGVLFGNATANIRNTSHSALITVKNFDINGGLVLTSPIGYLMATDHSKWVFENCAFGTATTHSTSDTNITGYPTYCDSAFRNCVFSSTTLINNTLTFMPFGSSLTFAKYQQIAGNHLSHFSNGNIRSDTAIFNAASPSQRLTPSAAINFNKFSSAPVFVAVPSGQSCTFNVYVRKSVAGDGAAYNGNQPRLMLKTDTAAGIFNDMVLATATTANGNWELLSGSTPSITDNAVFQAYVDCDGTTGWVNVDDWRTF